jgi:hypothetical protein
MIRIVSAQKSLSPPSDKRCEPQRQITEVELATQSWILAIGHLSGKPRFSLPIWRDFPQADF